MCRVACAVGVFLFGKSREPGCRLVGSLSLVRCLSCRRRRRRRRDGDAAAHRPMSKSDESFVSTPIVIEILSCEHFFMAGKVLPFIGASVRAHTVKAPARGPPGGRHVRTKINQNQSLFGSKGVVSIVFWIRGQICAFLVISNRLVQFSGSGVKKVSRVPNAPHHTNISLKVVGASSTEVWQLERRVC